MPTESEHSSTPIDSHHDVKSLLQQYKLLADKVKSLKNNVKQLLERFDKTQIEIHTLKDFINNPNHSQDSRLHIQKQLTEWETFLYESKLKLEDVKYQILNLLNHVDDILHQMQSEKSSFTFDLTESDIILNGFITKYFRYQSTLSSIQDKSIMYELYWTRLYV